MTATAHQGPAITWAARYAFCDSIWRGRARLIVDAELESVLRATVEDEDGFDAPWRGLLESLVPRERSVATWMVVGSEQTARLLAPYFAGVRFVPADALDDRFARLPWETALVTVDLRDDDDHRLSSGHLGVTTHTAESVLVDVAAACGSGRIAVISARGPQLGYEEFVELLRPTFGEARVYGGYVPSMFAFAEFAVDGDDAIAGEFEMTDDDPETFRVERDGDGHLEAGQPTARQAEDGRWDDGDALDEEDDVVPLSFDNTLGPAVPEYTVWIGIIGSASEFGEGLTLIELPIAPEASGDGFEGDAVRGLHDDDDDGHGALRLQLQETRKVAELGALERQRLVERIDTAQAENAGLRSAVGQLREQLASALDPALGGERLDAALAREQSLRWRVAALEREVAELRVRPVDDVTAELETLRARLEAADTATPDDRRNGAVIDSVSLEGGVHPRTPGNPDAARRLGARRPDSGRQAALRVIEGLVRRIDHGGVCRASLRRELTALRRRLRG